MPAPKNNEFENYFRNRQEPDFASDRRLPKYIKRVLPADKSSKILDIGCGLGRLLLALKHEGYISIYGIDISSEAVSSCQAKGLTAIKISDIETYCNKTTERYDFIILSHVVEHIEKNAIIPVLRLIRENLLVHNGSLLIMVPNAQSNTGCYWAYEDFTHTALFTSGSIYYVLRSAGFRDIEFLDIDCTEGMVFTKKIIIKLLLFFYKAQKEFWNRVTFSSFHRASPAIYSYEIKVLARK